MAEESRSVILRPGPWPKNLGWVEGVILNAEGMKNLG